jgi:hypothetical protein
MNPICNLCGRLEQSGLIYGFTGKLLCRECIGDEDKEYMKQLNSISMLLFKNHVSNPTKTFTLPAAVVTGRSELAPDKTEVQVVFDNSVWRGVTYDRVFPIEITLKRTKKRGVD